MPDGDFRSRNPEVYDPNVFGVSGPNNFPSSRCAGPKSIFWRSKRAFATFDMRSVPGKTGREIVSTGSSGGTTRVGTGATDGRTVENGHSCRLHTGRARFRPGVWFFGKGRGRFIRVFRREHDFGYDRVACNVFRITETSSD